MFFSCSSRCPVCASTTWHMFCMFLRFVSYFINSPSLRLLRLFFSSRRRHTRLVSDWSSDVCSSDLVTYKGTPLTSGTIIFHSPDGYVDSTSINARGEYTLANFPVGKAKITVATQPYEKRSEERRVGKEGRVRRPGDH